MLRFNDGVEIDTSGDFRVIHLADGYYVVGDGHCMPCNNLQEAETVVISMTAEPENKT